MLVGFISINLSTITPTLKFTMNLMTRWRLRPEFCLATSDFLEVRFVSCWRIFATHWKFVRKIELSIYNKKHMATGKSTISIVFSVRNWWFPFLIAVATPPTYHQTTNTFHAKIAEAARHIAEEEIEHEERHPKPFGCVSSSPSSIQEPPVLLEIFFLPKWVCCCWFWNIVVFTTKKES